MERSACGVLRQSLAEALYTWDLAKRVVGTLANRVLGNIYTRGIRHQECTLYGLLLPMGGSQHHMIYPRWALKFENE